MIPRKPEAKSNSGSGQRERQARVSLLVQQRMILAYYKAGGWGTEVLVILKCNSVSVGSQQSGNVSRELTPNTYPGLRPGSQKKEKKECCRLLPSLSIVLKPQLKQLRVWPLWVNRATGSEPSGKSGKFHFPLFLIRSPSFNSY